MKYYYFDKNDTMFCIGAGFEGWAFCLFVDNFSTLEEWKKKFAEPGSYITNEMGSKTTADEMEMIITMRNSSHVIAAIHRAFNTTVMTGNHHLSHLRVGTIGRYGTCVGNEDCWDLIVETW